MATRKTSERPPFSLQRGPQAAQHQRGPQQQADEQIDLPEAAEVEIFIALVAEPEIERAGGDMAVDREPFAGERSDDDHQQADEQEIDAEALELRFSAAQQRRDIEPGGQPGGRDPQDGELRVPGAGHRIGEIFRHRQAVEALALDRVMRGDDAEQHLREEHCGDDEEIFRRRAHRRRDGGAAEQVGRREFPRAAPCRAATRRTRGHNTRPAPPIPPSRTKIEMNVHRKIDPAGVLPTSGSCGQLLV